MASIAKLSELWCGFFLAGEDNCGEQDKCDNARHGASLSQSAARVNLPDRLGWPCGKRAGHAAFAQIGAWLSEAPSLRSWTMPYSDQDLAPKTSKLPQWPPSRPTQDEVHTFLAKHYDSRLWHTALEISVDLKRLPPFLNFVENVGKMLRLARPNVSILEKRESPEEIRAQMARLTQHLETLVEEKLVERQESRAGVVYRMTLRGWSRRPRT